MSQDTGKTSILRPLLIVGGFAVIAVTCFFAARRFMQDDDIPGAVPEEIEIDLARVAELRNLGVAWVENLEYDKAAEAFTELTVLLPDEKLPWQNLAITKLLKADPETTKPGTPEFLQVIAEAKTAIDNYAQRYPEELLSQLLRARYFLRLLPTADFENAGRGLVRAYRNAIQMQPEQAFLHYQFYDAVNLVRDRTLSDEAFQGLQQAWKLDADNLHLMREMFRAQTRPDRNDPDIAQTFAVAAGLIGPYVEKIRSFSPIDPEVLLRKGTAAATAGDWATARSCALQLGNVLAPEVASQKDKKSVEPHLLEFLDFNFSPEISGKLEAFRRNFPPAIPVKFVPATDDLAIPGAPAAISTGDFNLDGRLEIVAVFEDHVDVWRRGETAWEPLASLDIGTGFTGVHVVGLDRDAVKLEHSWDADVDLIAFGAGGVVLIENSLDAETGKRSLVRRDAGEKLAALRNVLAVLPVDYDHDGDLDLIISTDDGLSMWLNIADWKFIDHSQYSQLPPAGTKIHTLAAVDWDRDVAIDVLCFGAGTAGWLGNILHGRLRWQTFPREAAYLKDANSCSVLESDANFSWDILAAGDDGISVARTSNPDAGIVTFTGRASVSEASARGAVTWDFDNDGFLDVAAWQGADLRAVRGGPESQFQAVDGLLTLPGPIKDCLPCDLDGDGDLDLLVACESSLELILNEGGNTNSSIRLPVRAESDPNPQSASQRVNMHCVGSLIEVATGANYQAFPVTGQWTHIGLGDQARPDSIRVIWTNGIPEHIVQPDLSVPICLQQRLKGSCPYIYTWDGRQFSFFTDCLWAAPVGLQVADGVLAPCREWEYLKIPGNRLRETRGEYALLMTEELWEIGYIDSMRLLEVLHPADVEIYSNEKVGPPDIAGFKVHTVRSPRQPLSAFNHRGRDLLPELMERDDVYAKPFDRKFKQGLTEPYHIEFALGDLTGAQQVTLFLTGWIRPTDTSLNIAISQRPDLESTTPPSLSVPDGSGQWQQVRPFIGFPGGKTKTIAIDLSGAFLTDDYRVRLGSSMEIYWDAAFFTVDESPVELQIHELPLKSAVMSYRGFSERSPHPRFGPERYDASEVSRDPQWPPVLGRLTPFGDVLSLLGKTDDQMVTFGAGDSIEVRFAASQRKVPQGWKRDFVLHNVGWDKDADLNTVYGQTVDPLPFSGMNGYPDPVGMETAEPFSDQSRVQHRARFWRLLFDENRHRTRQPRVE